MVTSSPLNIAIGRITTFHQSNDKKLTNSYIRVASQSNFTQPSDNISDYFRSEQLMSDKNGYKTVRQNLSKGLAMITVAEEAGTYIFDDLTRMKDLAEHYYDSATTDDEKLWIEGEFNALKSLADTTITNTTYDGKALFQDTSASSPILSINLDPNNYNSTFDIDFNSSHIADVSSLDITVGQAAALSDVQSELDKAGAYNARVSGYRHGLNSQYNLVEQKIMSFDEVNANLSDIDSGKEIAAMVERSISQKSSIAMLSQANMERKNVLFLLIN